jgi:hypothetical protein
MLVAQWGEVKIGRMNLVVVEQWGAQAMISFFSLFFEHTKQQNVP